MKKTLKVLCVVLAVMAIASGAFGMTRSQKEACHAIIHTTTVTATGAGALMNWLPGADNVYLALNVGLMTAELAYVFDLSFGKAAAETVGMAVLSHYKTAITARLVSQWTVGWIPFLGNAVNAATMAYLLEDIGWAVADAFDAASSASWRMGVDMVKDKVTDITVDEFKRYLGDLD